MEKENVQEQEKRILEFWKQNKIYAKSKKKNEKGKKFYMMDGPPYATGHIHMGTALNKTLKDIAMRSHRLQGFDVFDRAGYDTHGLPIEFQIEKEIGSKTKKDIEKFGVKKFTEKCKEFATQYIDLMNSEFMDLGVWMNFEDPYLTLSDDYIETIWDTFKEADKKKLLYLGKYPVHICPRCETAVAYNEIEYAKQEDTSIYVKFPLKKKENTFLIIWTTTPWTLPGNTGVMVHPDYVYEEIELSDGEKWIIAKDLVGKIMATLEIGYNSVKEFKGKEMLGWEYINPLAKNLKLNLKNAYKVVLSSRYVNLDDGTGLVHSAPGHGKEDYEVGKEYKLDMPSPVDISGNLTEEAGKYSGKRARVVDSEIIEDLEKDNALVYKNKYSHDYPLCWRCKTPLLMVSQPQWFLKISDIHKNLLESNEKTNWIPSWSKLSMKSWLEGISDWPVSRMRYWGTPLPIWVCEKCNKKIVIGSIAELKKLSKAKKIGLHKPEIDKIEIKCSCKGTMKRVPEILDVWFDAGVSSWAALKYIENKKAFEEFWPAELNIEGRDQIRGWWNAQIILSEVKFGKKPFDNIMMHGMVLDLAKKKMSKSEGNIISPQDVINTYGRDYMRYYFAKSSKGDDFAYSEKEFDDISNVFRVLNNVNTFVNQIESKKLNVEIEDKWILSRFNTTLKQIIENYNSFKFPEVVRLLEEFLMSNLSRTYIQMIRERSNETKEMLNEIRLEILKLFSPIIPFMTEKIWQELKEKGIVKEESIHLSNFPKVNEKLIDEEFEKTFWKVLQVIEIGMAERNKVQIGLKWPLAKATLTMPAETNFSEELKGLIKRQLNLKDIVIKKGNELKIELDTKMNPELESEGFVREISRRVQDARKKAGLNKTDRIDLSVGCDAEMTKLLKKNEKMLMERTNTFKLEIGNVKHPGIIIKEKIKDREITFSFKKV